MHPAHHPHHAHHRHGGRHHARHEGRHEGHHGGHSGHGPFAGERSGRRERIFESGALKLVVLHLVGQQASHGYDLIRAIGDLAGGGYAPSPGAIYPTLTLLEDMGLVEALSQEGGRKQYAITEAGRAHLGEQGEALQRTLDKLAQGKHRADRGRAPELQRAMDNLKTALRLRFDSVNPPDQATIERIATAIDQAALAIERA
jgi:DNA-binding PadR family transcriptional regulator